MQLQPTTPKFPIMIANENRKGIDMNMINIKPNKINNRYKETW